MLYTYLIFGCKTTNEFSLLQPNNEAFDCVKIKKLCRSTILLKWMTSNFDYVKKKCIFVGL